jgi:hypothetical protein
MESNWLSIHIFYSEPFDRILTDVLLPFVKDQISKGTINSYFFIRYWENGPHIRLRVKTKQKSLCEVLYAQFEKMIGSFFIQYPSERPETEAIRHLSVEKRWFPNNSIQKIPYIPELNRYGGERSMDIVEDQFMYSSRFVLEEYSNRQICYEASMGLAIQMHLGFAKALKLNYKKAGSLFRLFSEIWMPRISIDTHNISRESILAQFSTLYTSQKENLTAFMKPIFQNNDQQASNLLWNNWIKPNRVFNNKLCELQEYGLIVAQWARSKYDFFNDLDDSEITRWKIYLSLIHMTNNRLGIKNKDESYIGYLIWV